jgi:hypothetical protein
VVVRHGGTARTTIAGFANLCPVIAPNTGLGHNSMVHIIEPQPNHIDDYVTAVVRLRWGAGALVRADAQRRIEDTVGVTGGCRSWYLNGASRSPTLWPASTFAFRRATRQPDLAEYDAVLAGSGSAGGKR